MPKSTYKNQNSHNFSETCKVFNKSTPLYAYRVKILKINYFALREGRFYFFQTNYKFTILLRQEDYHSTKKRKFLNIINAAILPPVFINPCGTAIPYLNYLENSWANVTEKPLHFKASVKMPHKFSLLIYMT